jgi:hypothetical protein
MSDFTRPEIYDIVYEAIQSALLNMHVAQVGIVQSYDDATQTCSVQPAIKRPVPVEDGSVQTEALPIVQNVPVVVFGSPKLSVQVELAKGDTVLLVYLDYSPAAWRRNGSVSEPIDVSQHSSSYPVAIPWHRPKGKGASDAASSIGASGGPRLKFSSSAIEAGDAALYVAISDKVDAALQALASAFSSWTPVPMDGGAALKTVLSALAGTGWPQATAGTVLKAAP